jgi:signal transduction histidine kinase/transcriptional regulator with PAS, ATPase and Fis domain
LRDDRFERKKAAAHGASGPQALRAKMTAIPRPLPRRSESDDHRTDPKDMILESMSQGVAVWDADLKLVTFNQRYVELLRLPPEMIRIGVNYVTVVRHLAERGHFGANVDVDDVIRSRIDDVRSNVPKRRERFLPDGRALEIQRRPMPNGGFVTTFTDISEVRRAEAEVERKSALLAATLNVMDQGLVIYDADHRLQLFNDAYLRMFAVPPGFVQLGMSYEQVVSLLLIRHRIHEPNVIPGVVRDLVQSARQGKPHRGMHRRADGTSISVNRVPLPDGGFVITFADITLELKSADEVRTTSALLKATQDNMQQGICVYDKDSRIVNLNRRFLEIYELPETVARIGANYRDIIAFRFHRGDYGPGDPEKTIAGRFARHRDPELRHYEHMLPVTGRRVMMLRNPIAEGGYVVTVTDVTEQRQAEQEIQRQGALLKTTFETISQGITVYDRNYRLLAYNNRYIEMFGFPPGFIRPGMPRQEVIRYHAEHGEYGPGDVEGIVRAKMDSALRNEHYRSEYLRPNGIALSVRREPMPDGGCVLTFADVTRRRAREERLRESEERYALALKGSNEGLWDWDVVCGEVYLSPRVREIANLDFMPPHIPANRWLSFIHPDDIATYQTAISEHFHGRSEYYQCEYRVRGRDDTYRWMLDRGLGLRGPDGRVHRMAGSIGDISARKDAEIRIVEAKEAAELSSRAKTEFLANISHELRTPLNAIIGFSEVMRDGLFGPVENARYREYLEDIHGSGTHLLCLINDILDVAKAESGKMELVEEDIAIEGTIESCIRLVQERALQARVTIEVRLQERLPLLYADHRKLRQIALNLLSNSVKFTPEGGRIAVSVSADSARGLMLTVADTGIGIAPADIAKALAPFGQVDSSLSRKHNGTGLGLPLSKALAEAHGGTLILTSRIGKGTQVTVTFPASRLRPAPVLAAART